MTLRFILKISLVNVNNFADDQVSSGLRKKTKTLRKTEILCNFP